MADANITTFNKNLTALLTFLEKAHPDNGHVFNLKNKIRLVKGESREFLAENAGPFLIAYAEKINKRDEEFFMNMDNIKELQTIDKNSDEAQLIIPLFNLIKITYSGANQAVKDDLYNKVLEMLQSYIKYVLSQKK